MLQAEMDSLLASPLRRKTNEAREVDQKRLEMQGELQNNRGHAVVVGSRAHLVKSDAVVKVSWTSISR
jgi:hypothetical protein